MAFIIPDTGICSKVSFYMRTDFRDDIPFNNYVVSHYIENGDQQSLIFYINKYLNTNVIEKRPGTPAFLIMPNISEFHSPPF